VELALLGRSMAAQSMQAGDDAIGDIPSYAWCCDTASAMLPVHAVTTASGKGPPFIWWHPPPSNRLFWTKAIRDRENHPLVFPTTLCGGPCAVGREGPRYHSGAGRAAPASAGNMSPAPPPEPSELTHSGEGAGGAVLPSGQSAVLFTWRPPDPGGPRGTAANAGPTGRITFQCRRQYSSSKKRKCRGVPPGRLGPLACDVGSTLNRTRRLPVISRGQHRIFETPIVGSLQKRIRNSSRRISWQCYHEC
jgi:hypothetical protein